MKTRDMLSIDSRDTGAVQRLYGTLWHETLEDCADAQIGYVTALAANWTFSACYRLGSDKRELDLLARLSGLCGYRVADLTIAEYLYPLRSEKPKAILRQLRESLRSNVYCASCGARGKECSYLCSGRVEATQYNVNSLPVCLWTILQTEANLQLVRELLEFYRTASSSREKYPVRSLRGTLAMFAASVFAEGIAHLPTSCHSLFSRHDVGCASRTTCTRC